MAVSRDHYYRLASDLEDERISAASDLITELREADSAKEWDYALDRLIKGLSSSRASARLGFSLCLSEVLFELIEKQAKYTVDKFVTDLSQKLASSVSNRNTGKNARSVLFGELFGLQSILNSGVIAEDLSSGKSQSYGKVTDKLVDLSLFKPWIREACFATIFKSLLTFQISSSSKLTDTLVHLLQKIDSSGLTLTTEGLLIALSIPVEKRQTVFSLAEIDKWQNGNPLSKGNLPTLAKIMKDVDVISDEEEETKKKGGWSRSVHFVWTPLLNELIQNSDRTTPELKERKSKKQKTETKYIKLSEFWKTCIDEQFFSQSSSPERKYNGLEIFNMILDNSALSGSQMEYILSPNLMRTLINQSSNPDRLLNKLARKTLSHLSATSISHQDRLLPTLKTILGVSLHFDRLTKSKITNDLITSAQTDETLVQIVDFLISLEYSVEEDIIKYQLFALDSLLTLVRAKKSAIKDKDIYERILDYLIKHAYVKLEDGTRYTDRMAQSSLERLYSILLEIMSGGLEQGKLTWPYYAVTKLIEKDTDFTESEFVLRQEFEDDLKDLKVDCVRILQSIGELKESDDSKLLESFELLLSVGLLQLYSGDEESGSILTDLKSAFDSYTDSSAQDMLVDTLVDLVLSYLTLKLSLMKKVAASVWQNLVPLVGKPQLDRLFEVVLTKENKEGREKLFNEAVDEEDDSEEVQGSDSDSVDVSMDDSEDPLELEDVDRKTSSELAQALGVENNEDLSEEASDSSEESESDVESMSDEQMMAIDSTLSRIFKQRQDALNNMESKSGNQRKQEVQDARELMVFFKNRVLDLLELFVNKRSTDKLKMDVAVVLLDVMGLTLEKQLGEKAHKLIKLITKSPIQVSIQNKSELFENLKDIQTRAATKSKFRAHSLACNQVSLYIVRSLVNFDKSLIPDLLDVYLESIKNWATDPADKTTTGMYIDLINWLNDRRGV
ncbi:hypothetical protein OGAPHI_005629 [Ogataea philodendri]|uniref:DNA polymerase V n=1 Tax=Ogataea philodendri TaxID=1378263 RepID=A0A9P8NZI1_9ASCO|nr:uncharacterized protein OGAPHI_005629 [Ogataea philodendri]KAH3662377.1 hypothetical protein OGAPHI_005629 [Ogataea philodendri]